MKIDDYASDRFNINSQLEHLQAKYVGTGHADMSRLFFCSLLTAVIGRLTSNVIATHLMLATTPFWLTLLLLKMNQLGENTTILCRKCCCPVVFHQREKKIRYWRSSSRAIIPFILSSSLPLYETKCLHISISKLDALQCEL
ncbi:uncharacterized protein LOC109819409 isoform X5 [Asparagus officinalis]|uniref:uncharacterized protein LOC109819409 isoform X5 n=1 Tax=Asparagus officinalis TaxID=4686 RepID=UPI00098E5467|nr:uncharacterized protein LOC109819409 isoform X5 [Asparagus officinalis]